MPTDSTSSPLWRLVTWKQTCSSLNHRKVWESRAPSTHSRKLAANWELLASRQHVSSFFRRSGATELERQNRKRSRTSRSSRDAEPRFSFTTRSTSDRPRPVRPSLLQFCCARFLTNCRYENKTLGERVALMFCAGRATPLCELGTGQSHRFSSLRFFTFTSHVLCFGKVFDALELKKVVCKLQLKKKGIDFVVSHKQSWKETCLLNASWGSYCLRIFSSSHPCWSCQWEISCC